MSSISANKLVPATRNSQTVYRHIKRGRVANPPLGILFFCGFAFYAANSLWFTARHRPRGAIRYRPCRRSPYRRRKSQPFDHQTILYQ